MPSTTSPDPSVTVLTGGGGGAKLTHGLARLGTDLTVVVNTADDAEIYGLSISPDLDTVMYTLAGLVDTQAGWGVAGDTHAMLDQLRLLGADTWFTLGDRDLATHVRRTELLRRGEGLSSVTARLTAALGVRERVLPMTDDRVSTLVDTPDGRLAFQEYFVARRHSDTVLGLVWDGIERASAAPGVLDALTGSDVVVLAPSNPFVSIGPILAVPGVREALATTRAARVAVSPVVGGGALKGPAATMLRDLGHEVSPVGVARIYRDVVDVMVIDERDREHAAAVEGLGMRVLVTDTVMRDDDGRERLARDVLAAGRPR